MYVVVYCFAFLRLVLLIYFVQFMNTLNKLKTNLIIFFKDRERSLTCVFQYGRATNVMFNKIIR